MRLLLLLFACVVANAQVPTRKEIIRSIMAGDSALGKVSLSEVVEATTGHKTLSFDTKTDAVAQRTLAAVTNALRTVLSRANSPTSPLGRVSRINETSRFFEDGLREVLNATPGFQCTIPRTKQGKEMRSGYPDLRLVHLETGRVTYLDPKVYAADSEGSSFRTFYFEPSEGTGKINDDAHHLILGIAHDGKGKPWHFIGWKVVDVSTLKLQLKAEFNASNRDVYEPGAVRAKQERP
ncbi:MAG: hypothetical protein JNJ83_16270 [Verrucomicrobiaceae bacterium]|nr:hypothetical protein [Verrucomicrobiaceae bacterium]